MSYHRLHPKPGRSQSSLLTTEYPHIPTTLNANSPMQRTHALRHRQVVVVVVVHSAYCLALIQFVGIMMLMPDHMVYFVNCGALFFFFFSIVVPCGVSLSLS